MNNSLNKEFFSGIFWATFSQLGYVLLALAGNIFLARFLTAEEFGVIAIAMFFVGVFNVLIEGGVGGALVRKEKVTKQDYSTVFIFNLGVSIVLFALIFIIAEPIALYYEKTILKEVLWVLSLLLIINAFTVVQNTKLIRNMSFKQVGVYRIVSLIVATVIACWLAYRGFGVWAIVSMQIISAFLLMLILWVKLGGIGSLVFSKKSFKDVFSFGLFTTLSSILNIIFDNIYQLIIGKYFSLAQVGYYYQAKKLYQAPDGICRTVIQQVFYSYLSKFQGDIKDFVVKFNLTTKYMAIFLGLMVMLIYIYSEQIIMLLYGSKWIESVFFLRLIALSGYFILLNIVNRNIFKITDNTHQIFYLEVFNKMIEVISIAIGIYFVNLNYLLYGFVMVSIISYIVGGYYSLSIVRNTPINLFIDITKITFSATVSVFIFINFYMYFDISLYARLLLLPLLIGLYLLILNLIKTLDKESINNLKDILNAK